MASFRSKNTFEDIVNSVAANFECSKYIGMWKILQPSAFFSEQHPPEKSTPNSSQNFQGGFRGSGFWP